jgi:8-oxo-dGTP diphosphatase/(d)CTP diphosphatase
MSALPDVVMAIIEKDGKYLMGKRSEKETTAPGIWATIGGGVQKGESFEDAVVREVKEEVGLTIKPLRLITSFDAAEKTCVLHWWQVEIVEGMAQICDDEHDELGWFSPAELRELKPTYKEDIDLICALSRGEV